MFQFLPENFTEGIFQASLSVKATNCFAYCAGLIFGLGKNRPCFLLHGIVQRQNNVKPTLLTAAFSAHSAVAGFDFCTLQITIPFNLIFKLLPQFAVLPNPVPDRQPCSALCRVSSLGPLLQAEIMAGFPEKVSDWTVMHFYPKSKSSWGTAKSQVDESKSLSKNLLQWKYNIFQLKRCVVSITPMGKPVKAKSV